LLCCVKSNEIQEYGLLFRRLVLARLICHDADPLKLGWLATDWLLYMMKPERSDFSGFIVTKKAETSDGKIVACAWVARI
jgi:hypothetical protein